jgi:hypothetical protein
MFWIFVLISGLSYAMFSLGKYSVIAAISSSILKIAVIVGIGTIVIVLFKKVF